jgi:hypothetical protein
VIDCTFSVGKVQIAQPVVIPGPPVRAEPGIQIALFLPSRLDSGPGSLSGVMSFGFAAPE